MTQQVARKYDEVAAETFPPLAPQFAVTATAPFEHVRHLLSGKPLRRPARTRLEYSIVDDDDAADVAAANEAINEPGESISIDDVKKQLGL